MLVYYQSLELFEVKRNYNNNKTEHIYKKDSVLITLYFYGEYQVIDPSIIQAKGKRKSLVQHIQVGSLLSVFLYVIN